MSTTVLSIAFAAGVLSFLSPCIIPMLGVYFSLITGLTVSGLKDATLDAALRLRIMKNTLAFVAGFSIVFIAAGAVAGQLGSLLSQWQGVLNFLGGTMILILALKMLGFFQLPFLNRLHWEPRFFTKLREKATQSAWSSFLVGLLFSVACSHCIAPTLFSILALAGTTQTPGSGMLIMFFFSLGLSIPYVLAGMSFNKVINFLKRYRRYQVIAERVAGVLMLFIAYIIYSNQLSELTGFLGRFTPNLPLGM
ncbi:Cytochrome c biogenesis protein [Desulfitobacterium hafniense]|uniref:Cytochrome c biogenesis protein n=1 Tax=Desulfitobacterium hafniense TaxID=49338 RepID=A0A098BA89_DESHA|nr:cytochrome c biogenesis protein CcdA [Desulfitobacterium hafniense]CDX04786.1 Cytochrome c biogenesis protein [Desulfitobacterium hafniense]